MRLRTRNDAEPARPRLTLGRGHRRLERCCPEPTIPCVVSDVDLDDPDRALRTALDAVRQLLDGSERDLLVHRAVLAVQAARSLLPVLDLPPSEDRQLSD